MFSTSKPHMSLQSNRKQHSVRGQLKKNMRRDTGQQIPCFDRCQLIITWLSNIKEVHGKPRLFVLMSTYYLEYGCMLRDSTVVVVVAVVRTRPQAIPLPMITMRKSIHGFLFPYMVMGLSFWQPFGPPELCQKQSRE